MLSKNCLKLLSFGYFLIISANAADDNKDNKSGDKKDLELDLNADQCANVTFNKNNPNDVVLTVADGYRFKTLKAGDKTVYTVDTGKFTPTSAHKLKHGDDVFFKLELAAAKPLLFKKKSEKEWNQYKYAEYLDNVLWKDRKETKELDASKFADSALFAEEAFGTGKVHTFKGNFKVSKVVFEKDAVGDNTNAKYTDVRVYVGADKKVVRLNYFYTGDERFKETYFRLVDKKWKKLEQSEANKDLNSMNTAWPTDYKPLVDKFSPLTVLTSFVIVALSVFYLL